MREHLRRGEDVTPRPPVETLLAWAASGQRRLEDTVSALEPSAVQQPSALPGWTRGHVVTHLARNADALVNLLTWARTGTPTPMYATPDQRNADIDAGAGRDLDEQLTDLREAGRRFADAAAALPPDAWAARVKSAQGRDIPAAEVPWMRTREVWLHLVDLDAGPSVDVIPDDVAVELVTDVASWMSPKLTDAVMLRPDGQPSVHLGVEDAEPKATVSGPAARIAGWLTGRTPADRLDADGTVPPLPRWL